MGTLVVPLIQLRRWELEEVPQISFGSAEFRLLLCEGEGEWGRQEVIEDHRHVGTSGIQGRVSNH